MVDDALQTIGQLRQQIALDGHAWSPDPSLPDDAPLRSFPTGNDGQSPAGSVTPDPDIRALAARHTVNPFLAQRRAATLSASGHPDAAPPPAPVLPPPPTAVDWRGRFGGNWLCSVQNQNPCGNCWAFATAALVETMVRIEHAAWSKRSEGDLRDGSAAGTPFASTLCTNPWNIAAALGWIQKNGIADPACWPFTGQVVNSWTPTSDRSARTALIGTPQSLTAILAQKYWLDLVGPIGSFIVGYPSLQSYKSGVWKKLSTDPVKPGKNLNHEVLVVGYDDTQSAWIIRNSWGSTWGQGGYGLVAYGQGGIDLTPKLGLNDVTPDPWTRRRMQNGCLIESGTNGGNDFHALLATAGKPAHVWREDGSGGDFNWYLAPAALQPAAAPGDCIGSPALISTTFGRNFETVYWSVVPAGQPGRLRHRFLDQTTQAWVDGGTFGPPDIDGYPGFIQSSFGAPGNFEVVFRTADSTLCHWSRMNAPPWTWHEVSRFGKNVLQSGPSLIQSGYGTGYAPGDYPVAGLQPGAFECVAVLSTGQMQHFQLDHAKTPALWAAQETFGSGIGDTPVCMIEGNYGTTDETSIGNFELCVATPSGEIQHWWRNNAGAQNWQMSATFGSGVHSVVGLIQSSWGNLEVLAFLNPGYAHFYRDAAGWHRSSAVITPIILSV